MIFIIGAGAGDSEVIEPLKVLIVDDDHDIHEALKEVIEGHSLPCTVRHAYNGAEALQMMRAECPHLLILDIRMPVMDGLALREEMLHDPELVNVYIAVFTGHTMDKTELQVLMADFYLPKPSGVAALIDVLNKTRISMSEVAERTRKRQELAVQRLDTIIRDLIYLRDTLLDKMTKASLPSADKKEGK